MRTTIGFSSQGQRSRSNVPTFISAHLTLFDRTLAVDVCPSGRPSVKRVDCGKTKLFSVNMSTPYDRGILLVSWEPNIVVLSLGVHPERVY